MGTSPPWVSATGLMVQTVRENHCKDHGVC